MWLACGASLLLSAYQVPLRAEHERGRILEAGSPHGRPKGMQSLIGTTVTVRVDALHEAVAVVHARSVNLTESKILHNYSTFDGR